MEVRYGKLEKTAEKHPNVLSYLKDTYGIEVLIWEEDLALSSGEFQKVWKFGIKDHFENSKAYFNTYNGAVFGAFEYAVINLLTMKGDE
jgi:hypothetical protein